jgi:hypothetical protein
MKVEQASPHLFSLDFKAKAVRPVAQLFKQSVVLVGWCDVSNGGCKYIKGSNGLEDCVVVFCDPVHIACLVWWVNLQYFVCI